MTQSLANPIVAPPTIFFVDDKNHASPYLRQLHAVINGYADFETSGQPIWVSVYDTVDGKGYRLGLTITDATPIAIDGCTEACEIRGTVQQDSKLPMPGFEGDELHAVVKFDGLNSSHGASDMYVGWLV